MYKDTMNVENVVVIGIRYNRTALRYMRLYSVMSRVVDSHQGEEGSRPIPNIFSFLIGQFLWVRYRNIRSLRPTYCIVTDKWCMGD